jgi:hypothetical protein
MAIKAKQHFGSLGDCLNFVVSSFPPGTVVIPAKGIETAEAIEAHAPRFLYRGENNAEYEKTISSMQRLRTDPSLSVSARKQIEELAKWVDAEMQAEAQLTPMYSAGYCQHYGLPTDLLDFTANPEVAGAFASLGDLHPVGLFAVIDVAFAASQSILIDLTQHPFGIRPRRQQAYGFFHRRFIDLKTDDCVSELGIRWYSFSRAASDKERFTSLLAGKAALLDAHRDPLAGYMQLCIDEYVRKSGKFQDGSSVWLSNKVDPAPLATKVIDFYPNGKPQTVEAIPAEDAGIHYDRESEQEANRRRWSVAFPDALASKF